MKYRNANCILPKMLLNEIQQYVQGAYIYIPIRDKVQRTAPTAYAVELQKRDAHIFTKSLEGVSNQTLADMYHLSASSIRRIVIKQRRRYEDMKQRIKRILSNWAIANEEILQIYDTAWQVGDEYVLKVYEDLGLLEKNIKISTILDAMDIPVGRIVSTKDTMSFAKDEQHYYVLSERLPGSNIVSLKPDMAFTMGKVIANLHLVFQECEKQDSFWDNSLLSELHGWIEQTLEEDGWKHVSRHQFEDTVSGLELLYEKLPVQLIHRDVHFGNFLFEQGQFSGYIDFDLSQRNIRIFDLCYFMVGLLSEEQKMDMGYEEWFAILKNVFAGYQKIIPLTDAEKLAVPYVMMSIELLFIAWFLQQNDLQCVENAMKIFAFVEQNRERVKEI